PRVTITLEVSTYDVCGRLAVALGVNSTSATGRASPSQHLGLKLAFSDSLLLYLRVSLRRISFRLFFSVGGLGLMRIVRGMQRLFREELNKITLLSWKESFSQGIGITVPKARTRDKPTNTMIFSL
ncbi:hypothetical protein CUMW_145790, partial [Citrus unshiu]